MHLESDRLLGYLIAGFYSGFAPAAVLLMLIFVLYVIGVIDHGIDKQVMRQAIAEFFFMASLTGRYTSSPETSFESIWPSCAASRPAMHISASFGKSALRH